MLRESRRELELLPAHELDEVCCFRLMGTSGSMIDDDAGLGMTAFEDSDVLSGLSHGAGWRRKDAGLI